MVVGSMPKVKQPALTAVCRNPHPALPRKRGRVTPPAPASGRGLFVYGVAAFDPGGRAAIDVADRVVAELLQVACRGQAPLPAVTDGQDRSIAWHFVDALLEFPKRDQTRSGDVTLLIFPRLPGNPPEKRRRRPPAPPAP